MQEILRRIERIVRWIQRQVEEAGASGGVLGLSGGIDSSVVAALCHRALGEQSLGLILPCHSLPGDVEDAHRAAKAIGIKTDVVDLSPLYDLFVSLLPPNRGLAAANIKPRLRMITLYHYANSMNALVLGTSNAAELAVGYFTKYGDGGADILPLGACLKGEVRKMAEALGISKKIIEKPPSAGLWQGQTDEEELGISYADIDSFLMSGPLAPEVAERIRKRVVSSNHKRRMPLIFHDHDPSASPGVSR